MGGKGSQTIGYRYYFSLHMGIGRGPVNEIVEIRVGDVTAVDVPICIADEGKFVRINKPDLFGGDKKEGGIQGPMYVYNGAPDQELQPRLGGTGVPDWVGYFFGHLAPLPGIADSLGGDVPNFRGVTTLWYDGLVCSMNPYPKEWSFRVARTTAGWYGGQAWYPAKATIVLNSPAGKVIKAMNPAHILYEVNTNPEWGRGMPADLIDENSYVVAANKLCSEGFGLCIPWFRQETIKEFIPVVIDHIGAVQYVDRETGKMTLRLIRDDYDPDDLPVFDPDTGLLDIVEDDASGEDTAYNEIIVQGFDPTTKEDIQIRVQNLASIQSQEEIISNTIQYQGLATRELVARVAQRELKAQSAVRRFTLTLDRRGWRITPGMPFKISYPARGIGTMIVRAGEIRDGNLVDGQIEVKAVQDIFGMPDTSFVTPTGPVWTPPSFDPVPPPYHRLVEVSWRDFFIRTSPADHDAVKEGDSYIGQLAAAPPGVQTQGYDLYIRVDGETDFTYKVGGSFTAWAKLAAPAEPLDTVLTFTEENLDYFFAEFTTGMVVLIDDEQIVIDAFDEETLEATVRRGVADTIPAAHAIDALVWLIDDELVTDSVIYQDGETVYSKALTRTASELLAIEDAVEDSVTVDQRLYRPYPPGDVQQDGLSIYAERPVAPEPVFTWTHRDRLIQADHVVGHTEASVGPEAGTTYTIRVYDHADDTLLRTENGIAGTTWTYEVAMQVTDGSPVKAWIELESNRDGVASYFHYRFLVQLRASGYGANYGNKYGGEPEEVVEPLAIVFDPTLTVVSDPEPGAGMDIEVVDVTDTSITARFYHTGVPDSGGSGSYFVAAFAPIEGVYDLSFTATDATWQAAVIACTDPLDPWNTATTIAVSASDTSPTMEFDTGDLDPLGGTHWFLMASPGGALLDEGDPDVIVTLTVTEN